MLRKKASAQKHESLPLLHSLLHRPQDKPVGQNGLAGLTPVAGTAAQAWPAFFSGSSGSSSTNPLMSYLQLSAVEPRKSLIRTRNEGDYLSWIAWPFCMIFYLVKFGSSLSYEVIDFREMLAQLRNWSLLFATLWQICCRLPSRWWFPFLGSHKLQIHRVSDRMFHHLIRESRGKSWLQHLAVFLYFLTLHCSKKQKRHCQHHQTVQ